MSIPYTMHKLQVRDYVSVTTRSVPKRNMEEVLGEKELDRLVGLGLFNPPVKEVEMYEYKGVTHPTHLIRLENVVSLETTWQARPDDIFVVTYAKAGTTWTQEVISALVNEGDLDKLNKSHSFFRVPYLEATFLTSPEAPPHHEIVDKMKSPRTIKSHLPGHLFPPDAWKKNSRIVYVARNPKDLCVSFYYFSIMNPELPTPSSWNEFFDWFCSGKIAFGPWWDHYLYYWNKRHEANLLFLKFEDMKADLKAVVLKIAEFLDYSYTDDVIDRIVDHCSFASMKKNPMTNPDTLFRIASEQHAKKNSSLVNEDKTSFMRSGNIGGWKSHFTVAQNEAFDAFVKEKFAGTGLTFNI